MHLRLISFAIKVLQHIMRLQTSAFKFSIKCKTIAVIEVFLQLYEYMPHAEYRKSPMHFVLYRHPTPIKWYVSCNLEWRLTVEINILYDALLTGYLSFENIFLNKCASITIFPKQDNIALILWASISWK